jgi:hypothetical protein
MAKGRTPEASCLFTGSVNLTLFRAKRFRHHELPANDLDSNESQAEQGDRRATIRHPLSDSARRRLEGKLRTDARSRKENVPTVARSLHQSPHQSPRSRTPQVYRTPELQSRSGLLSWKLNPATVHTVTGAPCNTEAAPDPVKEKLVNVAVLPSATGL